MIYYKHQQQSNKVIVIFMTKKTHSYDKSTDL